MAAILAIDQGTTSTKAYRLEPDGAFNPVGSIRHRQIMPRPGWVEHDPLELLAAIRTLIASAGPVSAVGLANQGETVVAWDAQSKRPLHNAIVWQDERTTEAIDALRSQGVEALTRARAGLPLDAYFSASKLRWLLEHGDGAATLRRAGRLRLGTSDAFFLDCLTGSFATDVSTASRTSLMDLNTRRWDADLCAAFGVPMECLPDIRPTVADFGMLDGGTTVKASIVDQQAALFGHACDAAGDIKITFGTGAFALGLTGAAPPRGNTAELLPTCAWQIGDDPPRYALDGGIFTAGAARDWLDRLGLRHEAPGDGLPSGSRAIDKGIVFVPAQAGLACPYWDRTARGAWFGLDLATSPADLRHAVLEGIALRAAQLVRALDAAIGTIGRICIDGGLVRDDDFRQVLADALGRTIEVATIGDVTAFGVARLCATALDRDRGRALQPERLRIAPLRPLSPAHHALFAEAIERARGWTTLSARA